MDHTSISTQLLVGSTLWLALGALETVRCAKEGRYPIHGWVDAVAAVVICVLTGPGMFFFRVAASIEERIGRVFDRPNSPEKRMFRNGLG